MNISRPSGTVTFLFTDIEKSTQHWEQHPDWMQHAFQRHESILREVMVANGGYVYKMIGDAFQVAFATATAALTAALQAQRALQSEDWGEFGPLRVRMGLHTGVTEERGDDYVGPQLNRVARVMSAGHGGQVLMTHTTYDLLQDALPPGAALVDMGEHRLKDLVRHEHIYQLAADGLQREFAPLRTLSNLPNNLPVPVTSFVGREKEIGEVRRLLATNRLVTLTGPGGTGKSRLALQVASELLENYPNGVWLVELASLADPQLIPATTALTLHVSETLGMTYHQSLLEFLRGKSILIIFDNCEHLIEACAALIEELLEAAPGLSVLATSREILGMTGEVNYRCPSLSIPDLRRQLNTEDLSQAESVRLFIERAESALPTFTTTPQSLITVARICSRLDGIPLAIELAAARMRMLSLDGVAARLDDTFRLLTGGSRTVLPRQQTLRACIDWSYNLLSDEERALFLRLSVFAGGLSLDAAEQICADPVSNHESNQVQLEEEQILDLLTQLVDKSLVQAATSETGEVRYRMLETIRQYARERLVDSGGAPALRDRHLSYFLLLAEESEPHLRGKDQIRWLDALELELDNLRYALEWSSARRVNTGLRLATALKWFWHIRGYAQEGIEWFERLLDAEPINSTLNTTESVAHRLTQAGALCASGMLVLFRYQPERGIPLVQNSLDLYTSLGERGLHGKAVSMIYLANTNLDWTLRKIYAEQALEIMRAEGDLFHQAEALMMLGHMYGEQKEFEQARQVFEESLELREKIGDLDGLGMGLSDLAGLYFQLGEHQKAAETFEKSLTYFQQVGNVRLIAYIQSSLGTVAMIQGNYTEAAERYEKVLNLSRQSGDPFGIAQGLFDLANLDWERGAFVQAVARYEELLAHVRAIGSKPYISFVLVNLATACISQGDVARADALLEEAVTLAEEWSEGEPDPNFLLPTMIVLALIRLNQEQYQEAARLLSYASHSPVWNVKLMTPRQRSEYEAGVIMLREKLGEEAFQAAWEEGRAMTHEDAATLAGLE